METSITSPDADPVAIAAKPSLKQRWLKRLKRLGWAAVWLGTIIALFYAVENWRGRRAWNAYVAKVTARGDSIEPAAVIPPPVPDAENFALLPIFQDTFKAQEASKGRSKAQEDLRKLGYSWKRKAPPQSSWYHGKYVDLAAWQAFFRSDPDMPRTSAPQSSAEDVLLVLSMFDGYLRELHEAKERPYSRFPVRYENAPNIIAPYYGMMQRLMQLTGLRATARLAEGDRAGAYQDILLTFRLVESVGNDPLLTGCLVQTVSLASLFPPLWEGLVRGEWTDEQLAMFERRFAALNLTKSLHDGVRGDRNLSALPSYDLFRENPRHLSLQQGWDYNFRELRPKLLGIWDSYPGIDYTLHKIGIAVLYLVPSGWYDQNKVSAGEWHDRVISSVDPARRRIFPDRVRTLEEELARRKKTEFSLYDFVKLPLNSHSLLTVALQQGHVELARIAIALERHRLRHGDLPETLSRLEPDIVPAGGLPYDPASGTAPHYKRLSSDRFTLYFDGWNEKDDGGKREMRWQGSKAPVDPTRGDWVWPQPQN